MPHRRRPKPAEKKPRVFWSAAERSAIVQRALALRAERPDLAGLPLLLAALVPAASAALGWLGAMLATARHLAEGSPQ